MVVLAMIMIFIAIVIMVFKVMAIVTMRIMVFQGDLHHCDHGLHGDQHHNDHCLPGDHGLVVCDYHVGVRSLIL